MTAAAFAPVPDGKKAPFQVIKRKPNLNSTNGGVEPWNPQQNRSVEQGSRNFSPMKMPPDVNEDTDDEGPREIERPNFGNTMTKFRINVNSVEEKKKPKVERVERVE